MKISEQLRDAAAYMRVHGFSPFLNLMDADGPHCFIGAIEPPNAVASVHESAQAILFLKCAIWDVAVDRLKYTGPLGSDELRHEGWNTDDAVAALEIAADIAECEGL